MNVFIGLERCNQGRLFGEMGEDAQLDLAVVGGEQDIFFAVAGNKRQANASALIGADGDILKIRVAATESAGARRRSG